VTVAERPSQQQSPSGRSRTISRDVPSKDVADEPARVATRIPEVELRGEDVVRIRRVGVVAVLVAGLSIAAMVPAAAVTVKGSGTRWRPSTVNIDRRDLVRWRAVSGAHVVRAYGGNWTFSKRIGPGELVKRRFRTRGTYRYVCTIHGDVVGGNCTGMCGRVLV
jgi:plastocyanin